MKSFFEIQYSPEKVKELWYEYKELTGETTLPGTEERPIEINEEGLNNLILYLESHPGTSRRIYINGVNQTIKRLKSEKNN